MLKSVYRGGSSVILDRPNDIDYFYYFDDVEEKRQAFAINHDKKHDNHFRVWKDECLIFLGCYAYPFMELVEGEEIKSFKKFNICEHKSEYKKLALNMINIIKDTNKKWYHILTACYMFTNENNTLTDEQREIIQKVHDEGITEELKQYCVDTLNTIE